MRQFFSRLIGTFLRARRHRELSAEIEAHLQAHVDDNLHAGMTLDEARRRAVLRLGGIDQTVVIVREQQGIPMLEQTVRELRHASGRLMRSPGFAIATILSLALAIGANIAI